MNEELFKKIKQNDKKVALEQAFPGRSCGNVECEKLCSEVYQIAKTLNIAPQILINDAIEHDIKPQYGCIKKILLADYPNSSNYPNKGKIIPRCRFGYTYGTHPDKSDKQLATQSKVNQVKPYKHFYPELRRGKGQKIQFHVKGSPGRPDILGGSTSFDGINDLLNQIEKDICLTVLNIWLLRITVVQVETFLQMRKGMNKSKIYDVNGIRIYLKD